MSWAEAIRDLYELNQNRLEQLKESTRGIQQQNKLEEEVIKLEKRIDQEMGNKNPAKPCIKAVKSLKRHWEGLTTLSNILMCLVIGRKNYYGSGPKKSAEFAAIAFSIIQTLLIWEASPQSWFEKFFNFMGEEWNKPLGSWLPWNMTPSRLKELSLKNYHDPPN